MKYLTGMCLVVLCGCVSAPIDRAADHGMKIVQEAGEQSKAVVSDAAKEARRIIKDAAEEARDIVTDASDELEEVGLTIVDRAGDRLDQSIDRLGDRAEQVVSKVPEATQKAADRTEDLLDEIKDWWGYILGALVNAVFAIAWIRSRRAAKTHESKLNDVASIIEELEEANIKQRLTELVRSNSVTK